MDTLWSALEGRMVRLAQRGTGVATMTMRLAAYPLEETPVVLWDTAGWRDDNYKLGAAGFLLGG